MAPALLRPLIGRVHHDVRGTTTYNTPEVVGCLAVVCFFFQAEDGIRDLTVTGVQTCALPIFGARKRSRNVGSPTSSKRAARCGARCMKLSSRSTASRAGPQVLIAWSNCSTRDRKSVV